MTNDIAMKVEHLGKMYRIYDRPEDRLKQMLFGRFRKQPYGKEFWAVQDLSLTIRKGETIGLIGRNGSGKSTTLQMLAGTLEPTTGTVFTDGRVAALLELGSGFNPEYTGRENISLYGSILGLSARTMAAKADDIIAFADVGQFLEQPVKTYSSGMAMRLAFAVAIHVDPDILIVDEALSVGDARFQQKCLRAIEGIRARAAVLMVTHDTSALKKFCSTALWINGGRIHKSGPADQVATAYLDDCYGVAKAAGPAITGGAAPAGLPTIPAGCTDKGTKEVVITHAGLCDDDGRPMSEARPDTPCTYLISVTGKVAVPDSMVIGLSVANRLGQELFQINSLWADGAPDLPAPPPGSAKTFRFRFRMPGLNQGTYSISPAIATGSQEAHTILHWVHDATIVIVPPQKNNLPGILTMTDYQVEEVDHG